MDWRRDSLYYCNSVLFYRIIYIKICLHNGLPGLYLECYKIDRTSGAGIISIASTLDPLYNIKQEE